MCGKALKAFKAVKAVKAVKAFATHILRSSLHCSYISFHFTNRNTAIQQKTKHQHFYKNHTPNSPQNLYTSQQHKKKKQQKTKNQKPKTKKKESPYPPQKPKKHQWEYEEEREFLVLRSPSLAKPPNHPLCPRRAETKGS